VVIRRLDDRVAVHTAEDPDVLAGFAGLVQAEASLDAVGPLVEDDNIPRLSDR